MQNFNLPLTTADIDENAPVIVVLFDLETSGFHRSADILQIAAKHGNYEFSVYIKPNKKIPADASLVNKLKYINGNLQYNGTNVIALNLEEALVAFYEFLCCFRRKCILTAHNCNFDYPKLVRAITMVSMKQHFKNVIAGFGDTLPIIRKVTGRKGKGQNKLENLANDFQINAIDAHNAGCDAQILDQILIKLNIQNINIISSAVNWCDIVKKEELNLPSAMQELNALTHCTSKQMRTKMVSAKITYIMILDVFKQNKYFKIKNLLGKDENDIVRVTNSKKVVVKIYKYLKENVPNDCAKNI